VGDHPVQAIVRKNRPEITTCGINYFGVTPGKPTNPLTGSVKNVLVATKGNPVAVRVEQMLEILAHVTSILPHAQIAPAG
jgi:hypothetical protein